MTPIKIILNHSDALAYLKGEGISPPTFPFGTNTVEIIKTVSDGIAWICNQRGFERDIEDNEEEVNGLMVIVAPDRASLEREIAKIKETPANPARWSWAQAKETAASMLAEYERQWEASGIDPATLKGQAGPIATYKTQSDYELLRPEDHTSGIFELDNHRAIIRAFVRLIRTRYGFRAVPMPIDADEYFNWLGDRPNDAGQRSAYVAHKFTQSPL